MTLTTLSRFPLDSGTVFSTCSAFLLAALELRVTLDEVDDYAVLDRVARRGLTGVSDSECLESAEQVLKERKPTQKQVTTQIKFSSR